MTVDGSISGGRLTILYVLTARCGANHTIAATFTSISGSPIVSTGSATSVTRSSATLNGTINPNGLSTTYVFQWGRTASYGNNTTVKSAGSGTSNVSASASITGLRFNTVYHYRIVATNAAGTTYGADMTFKTNKLW